jgi:asparagine synthase (glutamine-hydrolysing)
MSFQAGVYYFDGRPVPQRESAAILNGLGSSNCDILGIRRRYTGIFQAHVASHPESEEAKLAEPRDAQSVSITLDGRLDNREDLLLSMRDVLLDQTDDALLALAAYEREGTDGFRSLIGDWSLVIWDKMREAIVLASDFAGVRPLYYCVQSECVFWSTRLKPLVKWTEAREIDDEYVGAFLSYGACPHRTPYRGIHSVPPGHSVVISRAGIVIQPFWQLPFGNTIRYQSESDYEEHLLALFRDAVRCRLRSDAPVLAELSGGLDSSSIVCMASHMMRGGGAGISGLRTLSFEHEGSLDKRFYTAVEKWCRIEAVHLPTAASPFLTETDAGDTLPMFWHQLHSRTAALAQQIGVKTYITGQIGDVIMGNWLDDSAQVAGLLRQGHILSALKQSLAWSKVLRLPISWVLWRALQSSLPPCIKSTERHLSAGASYICKNAQDSITSKFRDRLRLLQPHRFFSKAWAHAPPERRRHFRGLMEILELRMLQPPEPLEHLCYTHPFAHRPLVTYMLSIPADIVCRPGEPRRLMRKAFWGLWPPKLRKRRSKDLFDGVFLECLRPIARSFLKAPRRLQVVERGYVDPDDLKTRLERLSHSLECNEPQLRQIILLELWLRSRSASFGDQAKRLSA